MTHLPITAALTAPLHHGAGVSGNTSLLRTQDTVDPDGNTHSTPFVSGNSVRHGLRAALAWHTAEVLAIPEQSLSKPIVDLLWSGGAITKVGAQVNLDLARRRDRLYPALGLLGFSAGSDMVAGTLFVDHLHLVCRENSWRLPTRLADTPHAAKGSASYRDEEFGTRHDIIGSPADRFLEVALDAPEADSTQMIYDMQVLRAGALLAGGLHLTAAATDEHRRVLAVAIDEWAPVIDGHRTAKLGAKAAVGYGTALIDIDLTAIDPDGTARDWWGQHLVDHRDEILDVLREVTT